jgi:hypothetical protein
MLRTATVGEGPLRCSCRRRGGATREELRIAAAAAARSAGKRLSMLLEELVREKIRKE